MWIDIEDGSGNVLGAGPICSGGGWRQAGRLNAAGEFAFEMAAADPRAALLAELRVARAWDFDPIRGVVREVGAGVIERITTVVAAGEATRLQVRGSDELGLLRQRTVGQLALCDDTELTPAAVKEVTSSTSTDLPNAYDEDLGTYATVTLTWPGYPDDWLYAEHAHAFHAVRCQLGSTVNATVATLKAQFYNGESAGWEYAEIVSDGTAVGGAPFAQSGSIEFGEPPKGWGQLGGVYIMRLYVETTIGAVDFAEVSVWALEPTADGLADIMAYAPSGWSLDLVNGYGSTGSNVYLAFGGESVLTALVRVAETLGENFILGAGKTLIWRRADQTATGLRAVAHVDPIAAASNTDLVLLRDLRAAPERNAEDLCSRVLPWGGGLGTMRPTLADTTRSAPSGFTLSTTANYLLCDAAEATYGRIEHPLFCQDIVAQDTSETQRQHAADTLFDRALAYLQQHCAPVQSYDVDVVSAPTTLQPGYLLRVIYDEFVDGYHSVALDADLWITEVTRTIGVDGVLVTGLRLATAAVSAADGDAATVATMQAARGLASASPPQMGRNSAALGIPTYLVVADGLVTEVQRVIGVADGVYALSGTLTMRGGVIVAITP